MKILVTVEHDTRLVAEKADDFVSIDTYEKTARELAALHDDWKAKQAGHDK